MKRPDLTDFVAPVEFTASVACAHQRRKARQQRAFLRGPVPWAWLDRAAALESAALSVALALRFRQGLQRGADVVTVNLGQLAMGDAHQNTVRRGLHALENAGLISVQRPPGCNLLVTFVNPDPRKESTP